ETLDQQHTKHRLWTHSRPEAVFAVLAQFDCMHLVASAVSPANPSVGQSQVIKGLEEALSQAVRWLHDGSMQFDLNPSYNMRLLEDAGSFATLARTYVDIADFHKMYGRRQVEVIVDSELRRVRFQTPANRDPATAMYGMIENSSQHRLLSEAGQPNQLAADELRKVLGRDAFASDASGLKLIDIDVAGNAKIKEHLQSQFPKEPLALDPSVNLEGFTVGDLNAFYDAMRAYSFCLTVGFLRGITEWQLEQIEVVPTQCLLRDRFVEMIRMLSGLNDSVIQKVADRLSYDDRTKQPDLFQQPLISGPDTVSWSVCQILGSRHLRNMLRLMNRTPSQQKLASTLVGTRDKIMIREFGRDFFAKLGGCSFKPDTDVSGGGENGDIDMLVYNPKFGDELLLIEAKAILAVDEINEVHQATLEMQHGQEQLAKIERILEAMTQEEKSQLFKFVDWKKVKTIYGIVVAAEAEPNDNLDSDKYPAISLQTIKARLRKNHFASPKKFWTACRDRHWMKGYEKAIETHRPVRVGDVTYELPHLSLPKVLERVESESPNVGRHKRRKVLRNSPRR
ncbi:MAG: hypothetical protein WBD31_04905, partial [Rubripirellula sp.]